MEDGRLLRRGFRNSGQEDRRKGGGTKADIELRTPNAESEPRA
jgi:hypothetical protein